jgi:alanine-glyoxylate transaminase/serine-glyoxylate transaminase/serine-pyruvate transaminase
MIRRPPRSTQPTTLFPYTTLFRSQWGIDAAYSGSQKCLSCTPGLSPVTFGERAIDKVKAHKTPVQSWFMDLNLVLGYWSGEGKRTYHHTAPINPLYGLHESLVMLAEEGIENAWARHRAQHDALKAGLEALGMRFVVVEAARLPQLNSVYIPEGVDDAGARGRLLNEFNLEIGAGLGALAGKIWRIGLMGYSAKPENVAHCLKALEAVVKA